MLIDILYCTGARISEVLALRWSDLDLEEGTAIVKGKGKKERLVFLGRSAQALRVNGHQRGDRVFGFTPDAARKRFKTVAKHAGLDELRPHLLRHAFATELLNRGASLAVVAEMLGHKNWATTTLYWQRTDPRLAALLESVNCLPYFAHQRLSHPAAFVNLAEGRVDP